MKTLRLCFAWVWIAVPLAWGVYSSALKASPLFKGGAKPADIKPAETKPSEAQPVLHLPK